MTDICDISIGVEPIGVLTYKYNFQPIIVIIEMNLGVPPQEEPKYDRQSTRGSDPHSLHAKRRAGYFCVCRQKFRRAHICFWKAYNENRLRSSPARAFAPNRGDEMISKVWVVAGAIRHRQTSRFPPFRCTANRNRRSQPSRWSSVTTFFFCHKYMTIWGGRR